MTVIDFNKRLQRPSVTANDPIVEPWDQPEADAPAEPLDPIYGIPEAIGTSEDFPNTTLNEYLGISREAPIELPAQVMVLDKLQHQAIDHARNELYGDISGTAGVGKTVTARYAWAEV